MNQTEKPKILIIDDEYSIRKTLLKILCKESYTIYSAENGIEGLESLKKHQPNLIILDLMMPEMNGIEFLKTIQLKPTDPYAVIILTGHGNDDDISKCYELGAHFFIKKPFGLTEFICLVKRCLTLKKLENESKAYSCRLERSIQEQTDYISKLSTALDNSGSLIVMLTAKGEIVYANKALLEKTGFSYTDIHAHSFESIPLFDEETIKTFKDNLKSCGRWEGEVFSHKKDGKKLLTKITFLPVRDNSGEISSYLCIIDDISQIIEAELVKEQAHKVYVENQQDKEHFKNNISHELLTPLHVISTSAHLLAEKGNPAELQKYISFIQQSASDLHDMVERILNLKITQSKEVSVKQFHFSISEIFEDLYRLHNPTAQSKSLAMTYHIQDTVPGSLMGDEVRLRQLLSYLLSNAIKFTNTGHIKLTALLKCQEDNNITLTFEVSDTGIGIEPEMMNSIFELYKQGDNTNSRKYSGLGLGLTLVQELVYSLHGEINVDSVPGKGSIFSITLPFMVQHA